MHHTVGARCTKTDLKNIGCLASLLQKEDVVPIDGVFSPCARKMLERSLRSFVEFEWAFRKIPKNESGRRMANGSKMIVRARYGVHCSTAQMRINPPLILRLSLQLQLPLHFPSQNSIRHCHMLAFSPQNRFHIPTMILRQVCCVLRPWFAEPEC